MRYVIDPGKERRTINFLDNIPFSQVTDLEGKPLTLCMSLMVQNGNSEMRLPPGGMTRCPPGDSLWWSSSTAQAGGSATRT